jgi:hypothetical protein
MCSLKTSAAMSMNAKMKTLSAPRLTTSNVLTRTVATSVHVTMGFSKQTTAHARVFYLNIFRIMTTQLK